MFDSEATRRVAKFSPCLFMNKDCPLGPVQSREAKTAVSRTRK